MIVLIRFVESGLKKSTTINKPNDHLNNRKTFLCTVFGETIYIRHIFGETQNWLRPRQSSYIYLCVMQNCSNYIT